MTPTCVASCLSLRVARPQAVNWCAMHDPHLMAVLNKTIPVVSVLEDGTTVHLVGGKKMPLNQIKIVDLPHPKHTSEIILDVEEISAVVGHAGAMADLVDKVLFINSRDIRDTCSEAESFKVGDVRLQERMAMQHMSLTFLRESMCFVCAVAVGKAMCCGVCARTILWPYSMALVDRHMFYLLPVAVLVV